MEGYLWRLCGPFGLLAGILIWFTVAALYYPYTAAYYVSRRNYNGLREKLDYLKIRVEEADASILQRSSGTSVIEPMRRQALARAKRECEVIEKKLKDRGMPWVTGLGYIELWPRVHRAEVALIRLNPTQRYSRGLCATSHGSRTRTWRTKSRYSRT